MAVPKTPPPTTQAWLLVQWIFFVAKWTLHLGNENDFGKGGICVFFPQFPVQHLPVQHHM